MPATPARTRLQTHEVTNQPSPFCDVNLYDTDPALRAAVRREAGAWLDRRMQRLGARVGSAEVQDWGAEANRLGPELVSFDRYGQRLDEARFHPAYHQLMTLAMEHEIHDIAWKEPGRGAHVGHFALLALFTQAEAGVMCPINMTYASVAPLRSRGARAQGWLEALIGGRYDAPLRPIGDKAGITLGMAMTEKQGGSDVRANSTRAEPIDAGSGLYRLSGHKWFCSAPMSDGFLTLAHTDAGLSCFLVPRITADGQRNAIHVMRLKDKLGNRSNASSEIEYHGAEAILLGQEGRGVTTIIEMVHHTRLGCVGGTVGIMRMGLAQALNHVRGRRAFQKTLIDQPLMRAVIADLAVEYEAAVALGARVAGAFSDTDSQGRAFARLSVALAKFWTTKRNPDFIFECMECHGGVGYVEETPMPRLYREAPVNGIWEGSGNVIALDVLRTLMREPQALPGFMAALAPARGLNDHFDMAVARLETALVAPSEAGARRLASQMALALQAALLLQDGPEEVATIFCATRLAGQGAHVWGALPDGMPVDGVISRHLEAL